MFYIELKYADGSSRLYINQSKKTNAEHVKFFQREFMVSSDILVFGHGEWEPERVEHQIKLKKAKAVVNYHGN